MKALTVATDTMVQGIKLRAEWLSFLDVKPATSLNYYKALRRFGRWLHCHGITAPTESDVRAYKEELINTVAPATVALYLVAVKQFFAFLAQRGLYANIALGVKGVKVSTEHKRDALTVAQARRVLSAINTDTVKGKRDKALIALLLTTGLRCIEVSRADVADIEQWQGQWFMRVQGKGRNEKAERVRIPAVTPSQPPR